MSQEARCRQSGNSVIYVEKIFVSIMNIEYFRKALNLKYFIAFLMLLQWPSTFKKFRIWSSYFIWLVGIDSKC